MEFINDASLREFINFDIDVRCDQLYRLDDIEEVKVASRYLQNPLILGGGSNILPIGSIDQSVIRMELKGREIIKEGDKPLVRIAAGELWHDFVLWAVENDLAGVENLSLIPGTVGAAPIQNIGAYGVELESVFHSLEAIEIGTGEVAVFSKEDCRFGYRESIFKQEYRNRFIITSVTFELNRNPSIHMEYGAIRDVLNGWEISNPGIREISNAIIYIRQSKLPPPGTGNAGSFFKNPSVSLEHYEMLRKDFPGIPSYPSSHGHVKVPAGWLIDQAGWRGKRIGNTGCFEGQALVLVNYGGATGEEVWALAVSIMDDIRERFHIVLHPEVNIWGKVPVAIN